MGRLLQPLAYLSIRHRAKWRYDLWYPLAAASIITVLVMWAPVNINIAGDKGLLDKLNGLIGILVGFFIAALAAVATFDRPTMDEPMPGEPPILIIKERGEEYKIKLSRRVFLSQLFGYLSLASFLLYLVGIGIQLVCEDAKDIPPGVMAVARPAVLFPYMFVASNVAVNTALGVYYLSYRIHDLTSKIVRDKDKTA